MPFSPCMLYSWRYITLIRTLFLIMKKKIFLHWIILNMFSKNTPTDYNLYNLKKHFKDVGYSVFEIKTILRILTWLIFFFINSTFYVLIKPWCPLADWFCHCTLLFFHFNLKSNKDKKFQPTWFPGNKTATKIFGLYWSWSHPDPNYHLIIPKEWFLIP